MSEANGVPPVAGLLDGRCRPFGSAQGPEMVVAGPSTPLRDQEWRLGAREWPFGSAQGPGMAIRGRQRDYWSSGRSVQS